MESDRRSSSETINEGEVIALYQHCGKSGHTAEDCWTKDPRAGKGRGKEEILVGQGAIGTSSTERQSLAMLRRVDCFLKKLKLPLKI